MSDTTHKPGDSTTIHTNKALLVINCQNDAFYELDEFYVTKNPDFVHQVKDLIPYFRRIGDVIWVNTEMGAQPAKTSGSSQRPEKGSSQKGNKPASTHDTGATRTLQPESAPKIAGDEAKKGPVQTYDPSSRLKRLISGGPEEIKGEKRWFNMQALDGDDGESFEESINQARKGPQSHFFVPGTKGADVEERLKGQMEEDDLTVAKHFYSAFDQTSLLTSLRSQLITEVYLCGGLTNASIYSTAADAVQHGLDVTVIENCLGFRSIEKHEEALGQMSDIMGVNRVASDEVIEECGGRVTIDSGPTPVGIDELSIGLGAKTEQTKASGQAGANVQEPVDRSDPSATTRITNANPRVSAKTQQARQRQATLGPDDTIAMGDSKVIHNWLDPAIADSAFESVKTSTNFQTMDHRGGQVPRLVAVQGEVAPDGSIPIYRHPSDESPPLEPFTAAVQTLRQALEKFLNHPFNHVLIQLYRNGEDNISEHADKTLDIVPKSPIVNVSLGAQRTMLLRTKKPSPTESQPSPEQISSTTPRAMQRVPLPHNSVFILGHQSNQHYLHSIRADKRPHSEKNPAELAYDGERISLTFRHIGTFLNPTKNTIWGVGATSSTKETAKPVSKDKNQAEQMLAAFGAENHSAEFERGVGYKGGFDVVDLSSAIDTTASTPTSVAATNGGQKRFREPVTLALSSDAIANLRVQLALRAAGIRYSIVSRPPLAVTEPSGGSSLQEKPYIHGLQNTDHPVLTGVSRAGAVVGDVGKKEEAIIEGDLAILIALEKVMRREEHRYTTAELYRCIAQSNELLYLWYELLSLDDEDEEEGGGSEGAGGKGKEATTSKRPSFGSNRQAPDGSAGLIPAAAKGGDVSKGSVRDFGKGVGVTGKGAVAGLGPSTSLSTLTTRPPMAQRNPSARSISAAEPTRRYDIENRNPPLPELVFKEELNGMLEGWEGYLRGKEREGGVGGEGFFLGGKEFSVIDCAFWPVFRAVLMEEEEEEGEGGGWGGGKGGKGRSTGSVTADGRAVWEVYPGLVGYHRLVEGVGIVGDVVGRR